MMKHQHIRYFPLPLFASVMGFAAVTIAISRFELVHQMNDLLSTLFLIVTTLLFLLNISILIYRLFRYQGDVIKDFNHPIKMNFFATISISLLLLAVPYFNWSPSFSHILWVFGAFIQLTLTLIILTKLMWNSTIQVAHFTPVSFIPIVGNLVVPLAGSYHMSSHINWFFFGIGIFFSIVFITLFFYRAFFTEPLPKPLIPTIFILLAPPAVGYVSYMSIVGEIDTFAHILYGIALFIGLFLVMHIKRILQGPFFISSWALLFPSGAMTIATIRMFTETGYVLYQWAYSAQLICLLLLIIYLSWKTVQLARQGTLCIRDA